MNFSLVAPILSLLVLIPCCWKQQGSYFVDVDVDDTFVPVLYLSSIATSILHWPPMVVVTS